MNKTHTFLNLPKRDIWAALLMGTAAFFVIGGYEFVRSPSNTLFQAAYGAKNLPLIQALMPFGTLLLIYFFGKTLTAFGAKRTLLFSNIFSGFFILLCFFTIKSGSKLATGFLYIFREAYIVIIIEQYWSFLNSTQTEHSAKKLNGLVLGIATLGAVLAGTFIYKFSTYFGTAQLLIFATFLFLPSALFSHLAYQKCGEPKVPSLEKGQQFDTMGIGEFKKTPLLVFLFLLIVITQVVSTVLGLSFQTYLQSEISNLDLQTSYSGAFYATVNGIATFFQFIGAPLLLSWIGLRWILISIPVIHLTLGALLFSSASLKTSALALLVFKTLDYSLFPVCVEILYIPLSFDARYRAKQMIETFGYRLSKGATSLLVMLLHGLGLTGVSLYSGISMGAAALWGLLILPITKNVKKSAEPGN